MITSAGWYLPGNTTEFYAIDPCADLTDLQCEHVLGGGAALWQRDPYVHPQRSAAARSSCLEESGSTVCVWLQEPGD